MDVPREDYDKLRREIESADSPVGIDAMKAHVVILYKLTQIEERLTRIERELQIGDRYNT